MSEDTYRLPPDYSIRKENAQFLDGMPGLTYQPLVYELAAFLAERSGASRLVDIGSGPAAKLKSLDGKLELICIDRAPALDVARASLTGATFVECDLESGLSSLPQEIFSDAIVICADVLEHLRGPHCLARDLGQVLGAAKFVLASTPDRTRARGLLDLGPPANPAHTMEWSADEFGRFLKDCSWSPSFFLGHTINTDVQRNKITTLAIAGKEACPPPSQRRVRVAAVIHTFNESDIIAETVTHLLAQGIEVHVIDNWSNDGTFELAQRIPGVVVSRFPEEPTDEYEWHRQLEHTTHYAARLDADWIIHHDADEIRCSPWRGVTLSDAIARVDALGYSAIDFTVIEFRFLAGQPDVRPPYQPALGFFELSRRPGLFVQVKAWKNGGERVDLASSGGHSANFPDRRVYPLKFLTKHYPLRTATQAKRKVFEHRLPRMQREQAARGWHVQYNAFRTPEDLVGWPRETLIPWHPAQFEAEYLVERLSGIGIR